MKSLKLKKVLFTMLTLVAVFMIFTVTAYADDYGNFSYNTVEPEEGDDFETYIEIAGYSSDDEEPVVAVLPDAIDDVPVKVISASAFSGVSNVQEVIIPDSVTMIENAAFYNCYALTTIVIPDSVTYIGESAFQNCEKLENVVIGNGVKAIGDIAFKNCSSLKNVSIGSAVESIGNGVFFNCPALTAVRIPASVSEIEKLAFGYIQNGSDEEVVAGFTFYADGANDAVAEYNGGAYAEDESGLTSFTVFSVIGATACSEHDADFVNVRVATDSYEGLDIAACDVCGSVLTQPNTDIAVEEESSSALITFIAIVVILVACVGIIIWYIKMSKKRREAAIAAYKAGKPLPDAAEKEAQEKKEEEKYQKKKAKQEANLRKYIDF